MVIMELMHRWAVSACILSFLRLLSDHSMQHAPNIFQRDASLKNICNQKKIRIHFFPKNIRLFMSTYFKIFYFDFQFILFKIFIFNGEN